MDVLRAGPIKVVQKKAAGLRPRHVVGDDAREMSQERDDTCTKGGER
jgi:hypothetical protein